MGVTFWRGTGVALALSACGGAEAQRTPPTPPLATAAPTAAASSAPPSNDKATAGPPALDFAAAMKREATEPRKTYPLKLVDGVTVDVESTTEPKVTIGQGNDGRPHAQFTLTIDKAATEVSCVYHAATVDMASTVEKVLGATLGASGVKIRGADFTLDVAGRVALPTWIAYYESTQGGKTAFGAFSYSAFRMGIAGTMVCLFDGVGFRMSLASVVRSMAKSARPSPLADALYSQVVKVTVDQVPAGYAEKWYQASPQGVEWTELNSVFAIKKGGGQYHMDSGASGTIDREGRTLNSRVVKVETGEPAYAEDLERAGQGAFKYSVKRGAAVDTGTVKGDVTSDVGDREELRKFLGGRAAPPVITAFRAQSPAIVRINVTRESPGVVFLDDGEGAPAKCEVDAEGRCRVWTRGVIALELVGSSGTYPRPARK